MDRNDLQTTRERWYNAFFTGDTALMATIEADSFRVISAQGDQSKQEQLDGIAAALAAGQWFPKDTCKQDLEIVTQSQNDLAVVSGRGLTLIGGRREKAPVRFSEVWQRHGGEWQVLHLHYSASTD